jgi:hypothetical protein
MIQARKRMIYKDSGTLEGSINGQRVKVCHSKPGPSNFKIFWNGKWYPWLFSGLVEYEFGIVVRTKKTGTQKGYPSEAVIRAIWRHLVDRYNDYDEGVSYMPL